MSTPAPRVAARYFVLLADLLREQGADVDAILRAAGLDAGRLGPSDAWLQPDEVERLIAAARAKRIAKTEGGDTNAEAVNNFLLRRFTKAQVNGMTAAHMLEEGRPIESLWDASVGATAYAKGIEWQNERVEVERKAGELLELAR